LQICYAIGGHWAASVCAFPPFAKCAKGGSLAAARLSRIQRNAPGLWIISPRPEMKFPKSETSAARSANMSRIRSKNTKPELLVRRALHRLGFRFRLYVRDLPGRPDIVLPKYRTIIQVKGCFWHGHTCRDGRLPKSNRAYWVPKLLQNRKRDSANDRKLRRLGWSVHNIWECRAFKLCPEALDRWLTNMLRSDCEIPQNGADEAAPLKSTLPRHKMHSNKEILYPRIF
jgi:DNA mismatch endonuclease (patch repair protein)